MNRRYQVTPKPLEELTPKEKAELRGFMESKAYQKLLSIVECYKPSPNCSNAGSGPRDAFSNERANARLGEIRGWELHTTALFAALLPPKKVQEVLTETFPDAGMPLHEGKLE